MSERKITELLTYRGFPHWLTIKNEILTVVDYIEVKIGDSFTFGQHYKNVDRKNAKTYTVTEILDQRVAKGNYDKPGATYFKLKTVINIEDITPYKLLMSN